MRAFSPDFKVCVLFQTADCRGMARYDVVLYGASGFTGQFCVEYLARGASQAGLSWAVAGR